MKREESVIIPQGLSLCIVYDMKPKSSSKVNLAFVKRKGRVGESRKKDTRNELKILEYFIQLQDNSANSDHQPPPTHSHSGIKFISLITRQDNF
jgi:hypothetical protein